MSKRILITVEQNGERLRETEADIDRDEDIARVVKAVLDDVRWEDRSRAGLVSRLDPSIRGDWWAGFRDAPQLRMDGLLGLSGWRWLFLIEGLPTVLFGLIALRVLVDKPMDAAWLTGEERSELLTVIEDEPRVGRRSFMIALRDKRTSLLAAIFFLLILGVLGPAYWMPLILKSHGLSDTQVGWVSAGPYLVAAGAMVLSGRLMDRTGGQVFYLAGACLIAAAGFAFSVFYDALLPALIGLTIALAGLGAARPAFFSIPPQFLTGLAAAGGLALINSAGSLGRCCRPVCRRVAEGCDRLV